MFNILQRIYETFFVRTLKQKREYLIKKGAKIGENTRILSDVSSFGTEPYLIEVGDNCLLSSNITLMTHDGGISVLNNLNYFNEKMDKLGKIKIGNNVFIGKGATIMPGITVGDNVIIGLGSIVTKNVENNSIVCGIPAKKIKTIEQYYEANKDKNIYPTAKMNIKQKREYCKKNCIYGGN